MTRGHHFDRTHRFITEIGVDERVTEAAVRAISAVADRDPLELEPLYYSIDPDALNKLFDRNGTTAVQKTVTFEHEGYEIAISNGDSIVVSEARIEPVTVTDGE